MKNITVKMTATELHQNRWPHGWEILPLAGGLFYRPGRATLGSSRAGKALPATVPQGCK